VIPKPFDPMTLAASVRGYVRPSDEWLDSMRNVFLRRVKDDAGCAPESENGFAVSAGCNR
jgi:hypothetical protein